MAVPTDKFITPTEPIDSTLPFLGDLNFDLFAVVRGGLIAILVLYLILAIMVIKQILMMTAIVKSKGNIFLIALAYLHLAAVAMTLLFVIFVL